MTTALTLPDSFHQKALALHALDPSMNFNKPSRFAEGIRAGFAVISLRGKVWSIVHGGSSTPLMRSGTKEPLFTLPVIMIDAGAGLSKVFYMGGYVEGSEDAPDCFSHDGVRPDRSIESPPSSMCATCPNNVWGSKTTEQGKATKACADSKRVAVVPLPALDMPSEQRLQTLRNEDFGGPMLLRIPAASMSDLAQYDTAMRRFQMALHSVGTHLQFDTTVAYPKVVYTPARPLEPDEFKVVMELRSDPRVIDMLALGEIASNGSVEAPGVTAPQAAAPAPQAAAPAAAAPAAPAPQPAAQPAPATRRRAAPAQPAPVAQPDPVPVPEPVQAQPEPAANVEPIEPPEGFVDSDDDLDAELNKLLGLG